MSLSNGIEVERNNKLFASNELSYVEESFAKELPTIAVSEYMRSYANQIRQWVNGDYVVLGTDGFGRSDTRAELRNFFEISSEFIVWNSLTMLNKTQEAEEYIKNNSIEFNEDAPWQR